MPNIEVFDPRLGQSYTSHWPLGHDTSSIDTGTLVATVSPAKPERNGAFLLKVLLRYPSDFLSLSVDGARPRTIRKLSQRLPGEHPAGKVYFQSFPYSNDIVRQTIECLQDFGSYEYWIFGLFPQATLPAVQSIDFSGNRFSIERIWDNMHLFELVMHCNLDRRELEVCCRLPEKVDDLIELVQEHKFQ